MAGKYTQHALIFLILLSIFTPQTTHALEHQLNVTAYVPLSPVWEREIAKNTHITVCRGTQDQQKVSTKHGSTQPTIHALKTNFTRQSQCMEIKGTDSLTISQDEIITIRIFSQGFPKVSLPPQTIDIKVDTINYASSTSAKFVTFAFKPEKRGKHQLTFKNRTYEEAFEIERGIIIIVR